MKPPKVSLRHRPIARYFRERPDSSIGKGIRVLLRTWRAVNPRPIKAVVPMDRLLCGGEHGLSAAQYARHTGDTLRPSTPISQSPHVKFLKQYQEIGDEIFSPDVFRRTAYYANAVECMNVIGQYFNCTREVMLEKVARQFVNRFVRGAISDDEREKAPEFSAPGSVIAVRPIDFSDCYEVADGNHRLAIAYVRGEQTQVVEVRPPAIFTPLQQLITDYAWCASRGEREIYQPISSPELGEHWVRIRRCTDRLEMIERFLKEHDLGLPERPSYLDIACSYGWFVKALGELGFEAAGVEIDWAGVEIGKRVYGLEAGQVTRADAVQFLQTNQRSYDVVSCFSLLHHFILDRASISAVEMLKLIDRATKTVLFFDTGQEHEAWFRESLAGWNPDRIEQWIKENTSFTKVLRLGVDQDNVPPFADNYARTLFACLR